MFQLVEFIATCGKGGGTRESPRIGRELGAHHRQCSTEEGHSEEVTFDIFFVRKNNFFQLISFMLGENPHSNSVSFVLGFT